MAKATLPTNYRDDILNVSTEGKRKYRMNYNDDGTVSFVDVTPYDQEGSDFGAGDINATNEAVNQSFDKSKIIRDMDAINALTKEGYAPDALALKDVNNSIGDISGFTNDTYNSIGTYIQYCVDNGYLPDPNLIPLIPTMISNTSPSGVVSASSFYGVNYEAFRAFDGKDSTFWSGEQNYTSGQWIQYKFANSVIAKKITINNVNANSFTLQGSNDGSNFDTLTSGTLSDNTTSSFNFNNTTAYKYYRLSNLSTKSTNVAINTIQLYGTK